jgi:hypothetical protein
MTEQSYDKNLEKGPNLVTNLPFPTQQATINDPSFSSSKSNSSNASTTIEASSVFLTSVSSVYSKTDMEDFDAGLLENAKVTYGISAEQGYKTVHEMGGMKRRIPLHEFMEDVHWPKRTQNEYLLKHNITGLPVSLFLISDGHGGK